MWRSSGAGEMWKRFMAACALWKTTGVFCAPLQSGRPLPTRPSAPFAGKPAKRWKMGDVVFVDSGTTMVHLVDNLANRPGVNHYHQQPCAGATGNPYDNLRMIVLPGISCAARPIHSSGMETVRALRQYNIRKAFLAATGSTLTGVTNSSPQEYEIKRTALECSGERILVALQAKIWPRRADDLCRLSRLSLYRYRSATGRTLCRGREAGGCDGTYSLSAEGGTIGH